MKQAQYERDEQQKKEKAVGMMSQVKAYYNSLTTFPDKISDGWHKVISMNNYDFCQERKVYVVDNKITKYVIDDWMEKSFSYSPVINKAKAMGQLVNDDGSSADMVELYFLEYINNPNAVTSTPTGSGKISFWTSWKIPEIWNFILMECMLENLQVTLAMVLPIADKTEQLH